MSINNNPTQIMWRDNPVLIPNEAHTVIEGQITLDEIPYEFQKVIITDRDDIYEIKDNQQITNANYYKVNYNTGIVTFHPDLEGEVLHFRYYGRGFYKIADSRIYLTGGGLVEDTLSEVIENSKGAFQANLQLTEKFGQIDGKLNEMNDRINQTDSVINDIKTIYVPYVNTYSSIASTYPSPQVGWATTTIDTGDQYRWDGIKWIKLKRDTELGVRVYIGGSQPPSTDFLWIQDSGTSRSSTVVISNAAPDYSYVWLDTN